MQAKFHWFNLDDTNEGRKSNLSILADGVKGVECTYAGKADESHYSIIAENVPNYLSLIPNDFKFGTLEVYANGAMNHFVKYLDVAIGVITIRP